MRIRYLVPALAALAVLAWGIAAILSGSAGLGLFDGAASASVSPACDLDSSQRSASVGGGVDVSPAPESDTANPRTQVSFLGASAAALRDVSVVGSRTGAHAGSLHGYSQGDGASFVPSRPFLAGERVQVRASVAGRALAFGFRVETPFSTAKVPEFPAPAPAPADEQSFYSLPGLRAPVMSVTTPDRDPAAGLVMTTNGPGPGQYGPLIYTPQGRLVWFEHLPYGEAAEDLNEQSYEGRPALTYWHGRVLSLGFGQGEDVVLDSRYRTVARIAGANGLSADLHEFQLASHGIAYITAYNPILCDLAPASGSKNGTIVDTAIQQIDIATGLVRWEWHSLDHVGAAESEVEASHDTTPWDYFHLNSIDVEPDGNVLISARSTWAAYQLQRGSGAILWRLGGNRSSFAMGPGTKTAWQHDARMLPDGEITLFDDGANPPIHSQSRAVRIALDMRAHRARLAASYTHRNPPVLAASQGNMQTLPDDSTLVGYGGAPAISQFASDGSLLFDAHQPYDMSFYRAYRHPWSALPAAPPALQAGLNDTGEETIVYASWNGATGVRAWRVLAGATPQTLSAQATIPLSGFESATTLPKKFAYAAVAALDARGRTLGASPAAKVVGFIASLTGQGAS